MPYFAVEDAHETVRRARELGGKVHVGPQDIPDIGRFAMLEDPQGAHFAVVRLTMPQS